MSQPTEDTPGEDAPAKAFLCPQCSMQLSRFTLEAVANKDVAEEVNDEEEERPSNGEMTLCPGCGTLLTFDAPLDVASLRVATEEEAAPWLDLPLVVSTRAALQLTEDSYFADELASIMRGEGAR